MFGWLRIGQSFSREVHAKAYSHIVKLPRLQTAERDSMKVQLDGTDVLDHLASRYLAFTGRTKSDTLHLLITGSEVVVVGQLDL